MSEDKKLAVEVAAVLDEFAAAQRAQALDQAKRQRITVVRSIGEHGGQVHFETVIDEGASADEIFRLIAPLDGALDRLKAKSDLSDHYFRILNKCGEIEQAMHKAAEDQVTFSAQNRERNKSRRVEVVGMTAPQRATLDGHRTSIRAGMARIDELWKAVAECRRILGGEDPFQVLDEQVKTRVEKLRGTAPEPAAA